MTQEELKLVLDALKWCHGGEPCGTAEAIAVVEKALTQSEQVHCQCPECKVTLHASDCAVHSEPAYPKGECDCGAQTQEPVACVTYKEVTDTMNALWAGTLEQIQIAEEMKNKKLYTTPPQSEQKPVAWKLPDKNVVFWEDTKEVDEYHGFKPTIPLYPHPQRPWVGLTVEDVHDCLKGLPTQSIEVYARSVEAKLKQKNGYAEENT